METVHTAPGTLTTTHITIRLPNAVATLLSWLALLAGLVTVVLAGVLVVRAYVPVPYWDQWDPLHQISRGALASPFQWLWKQHNEHRIVIPKLFLLTDYFVFHCSQKFLLVSIFATQLASIALLGWTFRRFGHLRGAAWRTCVGIGACFLLHPFQVENLTVGFQIAFMLPNFFALCAFVSLMLSTDSERPEAIRWRWLTLAALSATAALYSLAGGVVAWPVLLLAALVLRIPRRALAFLFIAATVSIGAYVVHYYSPPGHASPLDSLHRPLAIVMYVATYLGRTFFDLDVHRDIIAGTVGLILSLIAFGLALRRARSRFVVFLAMLQAFVLGVATLSALGRLNFGLEQATASRYQTFAVLFWLSLGVLFVWKIASRPARGWPLPLAQVILLAVVISTAGQIKSAMHRAHFQALRDGLTASEIAVNALDDSILESHPNPALVMETLPMLRERHWSIYGTRLFQQLGSRLDAAYTVSSPAECAGSVDQTHRVGMLNHNGIRLEGWALDHQTMKAPQQVLPVVDGTIRGFAAVGKFRSDVKHAMNARTVDLGWTAFLGDLPPGTNIELYAILPNSSACLAARATAP